MKPNVIKIKPSESATLEQTDELYNTVCKDRFNKLELVEKEHNTLLREIHSKIHNGFGEKINSTNERVTELKVDTAADMSALRNDMDNRFDKTDKALEKVQSATRAMLITIFVTTFGVVGTVIAAILTGVFGLLDEFLSH